MSLAGAVTQIETWTVTGVTKNFGLDEFDGRLADSDLPALVLNLSGTGGEGFQPHSLGGSATMVVHVVHYLISQGLGRGQVGIKQNALVALVDNYAAEINGDMFLNDNLAEPMLVELTSIGVIDIGGRNWYGLTFRHRWAVKLA